MNAVDAPNGQRRYRRPLSVGANAAANAGRVAIGAVAALVSTGVVARALGANEYGAWGLVLQISTFFWLFDIGLTGAVVRDVAIADSRDGVDREHSVSSIVSSISAALVVLAAFGALAVAGLASQFRRVTGDLEPALVGDARIAFVLVAGSLLWTLPLLPASGYFSGIGRAHVPALIGLVGKITMSAAMVVVAWSGGGPVGLAIAVAACTTLQAAATAVAARRAEPGLFARSSISWQRVRRLRGFALHASLFLLAQAVILNFDAMVVAHVDVDRLGGYLVGAMVLSTLGAIHFGGIWAMLPAAAALSQPGQEPALGALLRRVATYSTVLVITVFTPLMMATRPLLQVWVGPELADSGTTPLRLLLLAGVIRFTGNVVTQACFALDEMRPVSVSITIEAAVNLAVSVVLGSMIGANGVAIGTGVGAIAGTLTYVVLARRRAKLRPVVGAVLSGARRPLLAAVPIAAASPIWLGYREFDDWARGAVSALAFTVALAWLAFGCVSRSDRQAFLSAVRRTAPRTT